MIELIQVNLLWLVVAWPLLMAMPALHSRLPWPHYLAILPAAALTLLPGETSLQLPRLLFGTVLAVDADIRWILAMSVIIWLTVATVIKPAKRKPVQTRATTFFMLTLAGNLGVILTSDLVSFFSFSAIMSYGFYALLIHENDEKVRQAGHLYLLFLILADLALFEALLLAAASTEQLQFGTVHPAMVETSSLQLYLWMTFTAFAFKTGIWPAHLWLSATFRSASRSGSLLLSAVPVAMGLLGAVRWLPLGEHNYYVSGTIIQLIGVAGMLYAALKLSAPSPIKLLPAWFSIAISGLFIVALGTGLAHPALWQQYGTLAYPVIASAGILLAILSFAVGGFKDAHPQDYFSMQPVEALCQRADLYSGKTVQWFNSRLSRLKSGWHASRLQAVQQIQRIPGWQKAGFLMTGWNLMITLFVLLGLTLAWLAK